MKERGKLGFCYHSGSNTFNQIITVAAVGTCPFMASVESN
jgi:hypothetical protein